MSITPQFPVERSVLTPRRRPQIYGCPRETRKTPSLWGHRRMIPTKEDPDPQSVSEESIVRQRKKIFKELDFQRTGEGWYGHTDFVSHRPVPPRFSVRFDLAQECSYFSECQGLGKKPEVVDNSRSPRTRRPSMVSNVGWLTTPTNSIRPFMKLLTHSRQSGYACPPESVWLWHLRQEQTHTQTHW